MPWWTSDQYNKFEYFYNSAALNVGSALEENVFMDVEEYVKS